MSGNIEKMSMSRVLAMDEEAGTGCRFQELSSLMYTTHTSTPVHLIPEPRSALISALPLCSICLRTLRLLDLSLVSACYPSYQYVALGIFGLVEEPLVTEELLAQGS